jgi:hypothetical protein
MDPRRKDGIAATNTDASYLAWALITKCQGCTLDYAICDLGQSILIMARYMLP